jgi:hypothetical protein
MLMSLVGLAMEHNCKHAGLTAMTARLLSSCFTELIPEMTQQPDHSWLLVNSTPSCCGRTKCCTERNTASGTKERQTLPGWPLVSSIVCSLQARMQFIQSMAAWRPALVSRHRPSRVHDTFFYAPFLVMLSNVSVNALQHRDIA